MRAKLIGILLGLLVVAVFADRWEIFGVREERVPDYMHLTFQFIDSASRAPVSDVHVACTRPMVRSSSTSITSAQVLGQSCGHALWARFVDVRAMLSPGRRAAPSTDYLIARSV